MSVNSNSLALESRGASGARTCSPADVIIRAVFPRNVSLPVALTMASTSPRTTVEPISGSASACIVSGSDSPVIADWSTSMLPSTMVQSAGTAPPEASTTRSPGTSRVASMVLVLPSRFTTATGRSDACETADRRVRDKGKPVAATPAKRPTEG
jgi:hypothetical protein